MNDPAFNLTEDAITVPVSGGQYTQLEKDLLRPDRSEVVTHKVAVGPHYLPGVWVVTGTKMRQEPPETTYTVTLTKVEI